MSHILYNWPTNQLEGNLSNREAIYDKIKTNLIKANFPPVTLQI